MLSQREIVLANELSEGYKKFIETWAYKVFVNLPHKVIFLTTGNQSMKTSSTARQYVTRILGQHPVAKKNAVYWECFKRSLIHRNELRVEELLKDHKSKDSATFGFYRLPVNMKCPECGSDIVQHKRGSRVFRFASETLPGESANVGVGGESAEVKNTQYPEFKKWLPKSLIKKDITARNKSMIIEDVFGGPDILIDFVSYNQTAGSTAGPQRISIWEDEQANIDFHEEQYPGRLVAEDGDLIITCTPADRISWLYDEIYEKASIYYRTDAVCKAYAKLCDKPGVKNIERNNSVFDFAVIQAATDDNPTLVPEVVEDMYKDIDAVHHPEVMAIRRYGIFKQVSGRIFKGWSDAVHIISSDKYFPVGVPENWSHGRGIDYHPTNAWACGVMSLSPYNELFIWGEMNPSPEQMITSEIMERFTRIGSHLKWRISLADPLANVVQANTGYSIMDDMNRICHMLYKEGQIKPTVWSGWDTKSQVGRDEIKKRLKNSIICVKPFSNKVTRNGKEEYLPTIWVLDNCHEFRKSLKNWRLEEWANVAANQTKDQKETPQQKHSHFCMVIEGLLKHQGFRPPVERLNKPIIKDKYYQGTY